MDINTLKDLKIKEITYKRQGNTIQCRLVCKANIKELEHQIGYFTDNFIVKHLGKYLPIVKIIRNSNSEIVAKYYITPGKKQAKILFFNNNYFNYERNCLNKNYEGKVEYNLQAGDFFPLSGLPNAANSMMEYNEYFYLETFEVQGTAICSPEDTFDEEKGNMIALNKAMIKASTKSEQVYYEICAHVLKYQEILHQAIVEIHNNTSDLLQTLGVFKN